MSNNLVSFIGIRVTLRDITLGDVDAIHAFCSDPEVTQWSTWGPNTRAQTEAFVDGRLRGHKRVNGKRRDSLLFAALL